MEGGRIIISSAVCEAGLSTERRADKGCAARVAKGDIKFEGIALYRK